METKSYEYDFKDSYVLIENTLMYRLKTYFWLNRKKIIYHSISLVRSKNRLSNDAYHLKQSIGEFKRNKIKETYLFDNNVLHTNVSIKA